MFCRWMAEMGDHQGQYGYFRKINVFSGRFFRDHTGIWLISIFLPYITKHLYGYIIKNGLIAVYPAKKIRVPDQNLYFSGIIPKTVQSFKKKLNFYRIVPLLN